MVYSLVGFELLECNSVGAGIHQSINPSSHVTLTNYYKTGFMFFKQLHTSKQCSFFLYAINLLKSKINFSQ